MADARFYRKALEDVGAGVYAWMQPDGSWGYSNAGLITDGDECLLVDTLFDLALTREMLARAEADLEPYLLRPRREQPYRIDGRVLVSQINTELG